MSSHQTTFCLVNVCGRPIEVTDVRVQTNDSWDGDSRPDENLAGATLAPNDALWEREELNARVDTAWFSMTVTIADAETLVFDVNQYDARTTGRGTIKPTGGSAVDHYIVLQTCGFETSAIYIAPAVPRNLTGWMGDLAARNPDLLINQITMPGSHDAGMYAAESTSLARDSWARTQSLDIYDQLVSGSRYFDLRVYWDGTRYRMGHFSDLIPNDLKTHLVATGAGTLVGGLSGALATHETLEQITKKRLDHQGGWGPPLSDVLAQVARFMALAGTKGECVFLKFSHTGADAPVEQPADNTARIVTAVNQALSPYLFVGTAGETGLQLFSLRQLAGKVVTVYGDEFAAQYDNTKGVYPYVDVDGATAIKYSQGPTGISNGLQCFDKYSNTTSLQDMRDDQNELVLTYGGYGKPYLFLYSWTLTAGLEKVARGDGGGMLTNAYHMVADFLVNVTGGARSQGGVVLDVAALSAVCNPILFNQLNMLSRTSVLPNIVYCDFMDPYIGQAIVAVND